MTELSEMKCVACEGDTPPLTDKEVEILIKRVDGWVHKGKTIEKNFSFQDFKEALGFVNKVGEVAESEGHHPDISLHSWNKVTITLTTHAIGGLSENDFILAAKVDRL